MKNTRISTGVDGLDEILKGGFIRGTSYLILGGTGTGKTVLSLQACQESVKRKESCLYFTFSEPEASIRGHADSLGWDLAKVVFVDFTRELGRAKINDEYSVFPPSEVEETPIWSHLYQAVGEHDPALVVIDSATFLRYLSRDEYQFRKLGQKLINTLGSRGCVSLFLFEPAELEKETSPALAVDCVVAMRNDLTEQKTTEIRTIEVKKMRGSSFLAGRHPMRIGEAGITVWPHRIEHVKKSIPYDRNIVPSGIAELDQLLKGGFSTGTCTIFTGPSGAGKTTLATQFLCVAAEKGVKGAMYSFEEWGVSILSRCNAVSIPLKEHTEKHTVLLREVNPLEYYPDEFLEMFRKDVEKDGIQLVVLDSLRGYNLAMEGFGNLVAHMQNIINYCRSQKITLMLVEELQTIFGDVRITNKGVSYMADNVLMLSYAKHHGRLIKVINCLKKRLGDFEPELREFQITGHGIVVGERLDHLRGLLTGVPTAEQEKPEPKE